MNDDIYNPPVYASSNADRNNQEGIRLRDYFAAQAMAGVLADPNVSDSSNEQLAVRVAEFCYQVADAMLVKRNSQTQKPWVDLATASGL